MTSVRMHQNMYVVKITIIALFSIIGCQATRNNGHRWLLQPAVYKPEDKRPGLFKHSWRRLLMDDGADGIDADIEALVEAIGDSVDSEAEVELLADAVHDATKDIYSETNDIEQAEDVAQQMFEGANADAQAVADAAAKIAEDVLALSDVDETVDIDVNVTRSEVTDDAEPNDDGVDAAEEGDVDDVDNADAADAADATDAADAADDGGTVVDTNEGDHDAVAEANIIADAAAEVAMLIADAYKGDETIDINISVTKDEPEAAEMDLSDEGSAEGDAEDEAVKDGIEDDLDGTTAAIDAINGK